MWTEKNMHDTGLDNIAQPTKWPCSNIFYQNIAYGQYNSTSKPIIYIALQPTTA